MPLVYSKNGCIVIENVIGNHLSVFGIDGRCITIMSNMQMNVTIPVPSKGVYIVKMAGDSSHKVVVM